MSQSKLYSRLRLNPVPESILSPDVPVPPKNRPAQMDDPVAARRSKSGEGAREMAASWKGSRQHDPMSASMHAQRRRKDNNSQVIRTYNTRGFHLSFMFYAVTHYISHHHRTVTPVQMSRTSQTTVDSPKQKGIARTAVLPPLVRVSRSRRRLVPQLAIKILQGLLAA